MQQRASPGNRRGRSIRDYTMNAGQAHVFEPFRLARSEPKKLKQRNAEVATDPPPKGHFWFQGNQYECPMDEQLVRPGRVFELADDILHQQQVPLHQEAATSCFRCLIPPPSPPPRRAWGVGPDLYIKQTVAALRAAPVADGGDDISAINPSRFKSRPSRWRDRARLILRECYTGSNVVEFGLYRSAPHKRNDRDEAYILHIQTQPPPPPPLPQSPNLPPNTKKRAKKNSRAESIQQHKSLKTITGLDPPPTPRHTACETPSHLPPRLGLWK